MRLQSFPRYIFLSLLIAGSSFVSTAQQARSLSLQDAVLLASQHNRTLKANALDISIAGEQVRVAKSLSLPAAQLGAAYTHYFALPAFFGFGENGSNSKIPYSRIGGRDQFSGTLSASYPVYNPVAAPSRRAAQLQENMSRAYYRQSSIDIAADVQQTYLGILVLAERLKLQHESLQRNEKALADSRSLLAQGRGLRVDTLRAFTAVQNLQPDILKLNYAIEVGKQQLITLMGLDSLATISLTDSLAVRSTEAIPDENSLYEEALRQRPDLQALALQQQVSEQQASLAKAARLPVVSIVGQYQLQSQARKFDFANAYWPSASFAGAQVVLPLFTGFSNQAKIKQAELAQQQSGIRITEAQQSLKTTVKQVIANLKETHDRMQTQLKVKETALLSYDIVAYRYAKGVTSRLELTDAELALTTAQLNYLEAVFEYLSAEIDLARTRGNEGLAK
ncbi:TolC family protein [Pseudobacter ginsenosidimutans]|uniref:Outer membrane protein TolC n=1 Tax=Pseudobacter ginsenosidimutans TaxID=661488 RepID=A0A4Q7MSJ8_9BACT|nr:TolC family protein [Pseudobacter ginsenosidimutans]QEC41755.1 TolC family protein [Pseudobacter ginsenosidimutans]RZS71438.1 outer membrane protein TolC [Pseudobacter ginsenosidimutans]